MQFLPRDFVGGCQKNREMNQFHGIVLDTITLIFSVPFSESNILILMENVFVKIREIGLYLICITSIFTLNFLKCDNGCLQILHFTAASQYYWIDF